MHGARLGVQEPSFHVGDEGLHIPAAIEYRETGHANPDHYAHPPLKYHLLNASMKVWEIIRLDGECGT